MNDTPSSLLGLTPIAISAKLKEMGEQAFRGKQIAQWLYEKRVGNFDGMTNLSKDLRDKLGSAFRLRTAEVGARDHSPESNTTKIALRFPDGSVIESVLMIEPDRDGKDRITACISTQAGCAMGCRFCASGQLGLKRHLTTAEILEQFYAMADELGPDRWLSNVVYMGMGEPLHNWEGFVGSLTALTSDWGFNMSPRRITVSTVGMGQRIIDLAALEIPVNLAISLHAPNDSIRDELIPTNKAYGGMAEIIMAAKNYFDTTRRQLTFEYTLVRGVNDQVEHARELIDLLKDDFKGCNINLIPMNPVEKSGLKTPDEEDVKIFAEILKSADFSVHTRKKKGRSVNAACGQLRLRVEQRSS